MNNKTKECKYLGEYSGDCWLCSGNIFQRCMYSNKEKCLLLKNEQRKNKINMLEQQLLAEQAKNKKLVGLIETMCSNDWEDMTVFKFQKQMIKALNEVNNAK